MRPSALAAFMLMTNSMRVDCCTGRSAGLLALEDETGIDAKLAIPVVDVGAVAHQTAGAHVIGELKHRENRVPLR